MSRWSGRSRVSVVVAAFGIALAGCGGSSNHSSAYSSSSTSNSGSSGSSGNSGTSSTVDYNNVPPATAVASPAYRTAFIQAGTRNGLTQTQATTWADCMVKAIEATGAKTQGDLKKLGEANPQIKQNLGQAVGTCTQTAKSS
jgi:hypothetical protein